jgi:hypothetical protein
MFSFFIRRILIRYQWMTLRTAERVTESDFILTRYNPGLQPSVDIRIPLPVAFSLSGNKSRILAPEGAKTSSLADTNMLAGHFTVQHLLAGFG